MSLRFMFLEFVLLISLFDDIAGTDPVSLRFMFLIFVPLISLFEDIAGTDPVASRFIKNLL